MFLLTGTVIVTWWFILGRLNPFIDAALAIVKTALVAMFTLFFGNLSNVLKKTTIRSARLILQKIHIPAFVKPILYFVIGTGIIILDQFYAIKIYTEDETTFYHILFQGKTYWITQVALIWGGIFIGLAALYLLDWILTGIHKLLDRTIRMSIVIYK